MNTKDTVIQVSGIHPLATDMQLMMFFKQFTPNVNHIQTKPSFDGKTQSAFVYCSTQESALKILESINYNEFDGFVLRAKIADEETFKAKYNEKANIYIHFGFGCTTPTERDLYFDMLQYGPVVSVKVIEAKRIAFCQFYTIEAADKACNAPTFAGITISKKSAPRAQTQKKDFAKTRNQPHVFKIEPVTKKEKDNSSEKSHSSRASKSSRAQKNPFIMKRQNSTQDVAM